MKTKKRPLFVGFLGILYDLHFSAVCLQFFKSMFNFEIDND